MVDIKIHFCIDRVALHLKSDHCIPKDLLDIDFYVFFHLPDEKGRE